MGGFGRATFPSPMGIQCGIVGLPNVGKSTIFNAITNAGAQAANYPFCTVDPNVGTVTVPDARVDKLSEVVKPRNIMRAVMQFVDIAGLVRGASKGEGLGNQFLSHIREVDAVMHVVRCFEDGDVTHVEGSVDPLRDIGIIDTELALKDMETVEKRLSKDERAAKSQDKKAKAAVEVWNKLLVALNEAKAARTVALTEDEAEIAKELQLLTSKPVLYCCNVLESEIQTGNAHVELVREHAATEGAQVVMISGKIEAELSQLEPDEKKVFLEELGMKESGLDTVIRAAYSLLGLQTYLTAGVQEVRAWTFRKGWKGPACAGVIHSDFEKGFIRAETISWKDFETYGSQLACKEKGLQRSEGKEYVVQDGDILNFLFNV
jgi:GTP-binding protein YchF